MYLLIGNKYNYYGIKYFHSHQIEKNDSLYFAGELVPLSDKTVKEKIEKELYLLTYYRSSTKKLLRKMDYWLPQFEPIIKSYNVPEDFKYLVVIESNLKNATSNKYAVGFWQFQKSTARENGLMITSQIDQRYDQYYSTIAACKYLKKMYRRLGSWSSVAASYNMGLTAFKRQQRLQRETSYFNLNLNRETGRYVYKMIALKIIDDNRKSYGYRHYHLNKVNEFDEAVVDTTISDLRSLAYERGISMDSLREINPWVLGDEIINPENRYRLLFPKKQYKEVKKAEVIMSDSIVIKDTTREEKLDTLIVD